MSDRFVHFVVKGYWVDGKWTIGNKPFPRYFNIRNIESFGDSEGAALILTCVSQHAYIIDGTIDDAFEKVSHA